MSLVVKLLTFIHTHTPARQWVHNHRDTRGPGRGEGSDRGLQAGEELSVEDDRVEEEEEEVVQLPAWARVVKLSDWAQSEEASVEVRSACILGSIYVRKLISVNGVFDGGARTTACQRLAGPMRY